MLSTFNSEFNQDYAPRMALKALTLHTVIHMPLMSNILSSSCVISSVFCVFFVDKRK